MVFAGADELRRPARIYNGYFYSVLDIKTISPFSWPVPLSSPANGDWGELLETDCVTRFIRSELVKTGSSGASKALRR